MILFFAVGCVGRCPTFDEADAAALAAWENVIGEVSAECLDEAGLYETIFGDGGDCGDPRPWVVPNGCVDRKNRIIYITEADFLGCHDQAETYVHEMIHIYAACELGDADGNHSDPLLWGIGGSVEHVGKGML